MVITVEPGLYFGAWRPDVECPERYANLGIRIEDDVLITKDGPDVLSDCPKTIDNIEAIVGQLGDEDVFREEILENQVSNFSRLTPSEAIILYEMHHYTN